MGAGLARVAGGACRGVWRSEDAGKREGKLMEKTREKWREGKDVGPLPAEKPYAFKDKKNVRPFSCEMKAIQQSGDSEEKMKKDTKGRRRTARRGVTAGDPRSHYPALIPTRGDCVYMRLCVSTCCHDAHWCSISNLQTHNMLAVGPQPPHHPPTVSLIKQSESESVPIK